MKELWKDVTGYEDIYQVSDLGRVKSLAKLLAALISPLWLIAALSWRTND